MNVLVRSIGVNTYCKYENLPVNGIKMEGNPGDPEMAIYHCNLQSEGNTAKQVWAGNPGIGCREKCGKGVESL